jgi:hypothetical protein
MGSVIATAIAVSLHNHHVAGGLQETVRRIRNSSRFHLTVPLAAPVVRRRVAQNRAPRPGSAIDIIGSSPDI